MESRIAMMTYEDKENNCIWAWFKAGQHLVRRQPGPVLLLAAYTVSEIKGWQIKKVGREMSLLTLMVRQGKTVLWGHQMGSRPMTWYLLNRQKRTFRQKERHI